MRLKNIIVTIVWLIAMLPSFARATIIDNGYYTTVDESDWLDISLTTAKSYNDVLALLAPGQEFSGWRVASYVEVTGFYSSFGYDYMPNTTDLVSGSNQNANFEDLHSIHGWTYADGVVMGYVSDVGNDFTGRSDKEVQPTWQQVVETTVGCWQACPDIMGQWRGNSWGFDQSTAFWDVGTFLVRDTESVPEPSTLAIFALGIMGLVIRRKNKA